MQGVELTIAMAALLGVACGAVGGFLALLCQRGQRLRVQTELQQAQQDSQQLLEAQQAQRLTTHQLQTLLEYLQSAEQRLVATNEGLNEQLEALRQRSHGAEKALEAARASLESAQQRVAALEDDAQKQQRLYQQLQEEHLTLSKAHTALKTSLERKEESFKEQLQQLHQVRHSLTQEFEILANKIFDEKGKTFTQASETNITNKIGRAHV